MQCARRLAAAGSQPTATTEDILDAARAAGDGGDEFTGTCTCGYVPYVLSPGPYGAYNPNFDAYFGGFLDTSNTPILNGNRAHLRVPGRL